MKGPGPAKAKLFLDDMLFFFLGSKFSLDTRKKAPSLVVGAVAQPHPSVFVRIDHEESLYFLMSAILFQILA
jgi:hypothetical protein